MKLINCTSHPITIFHEDGQRTIIQPSGIHARCLEHIEPAGTLRPDIYGDIPEVPVVRKSLRAIVDLPEPEPDTYFIVSLAVAQAAAQRVGYREDLLVPDDMVYDRLGRVVGCRRFAIVPSPKPKLKSKSKPKPKRSSTSLRALGVCKKCGNKLKGSMFTGNDMQVYCEDCFTPDLW